MPDTSQDRSKTNNRNTYAVTKEGLKRANSAYRRGGYSSKKAFAELCKLSKSTVDKFFGGTPIEPDCFKAIHKRLEMLGDWKEIADIECLSSEKQLPPEAEATNYHKLVDERIPFSLAGSVKKEDIAKLKNAIQLLRKLTKDDLIDVIDIEEGSIKLTLKGSPAGLQRLEQLFQSGELAKIFEQELNITVEDVNFITSQNSDQERPSQTATTEKTQLAFTIAGNVNQADIDILKAALIDTSDDEDIQSDKKKSSLVKLIKTQGAEELNLIYANLSGANLSGAYLSGYNLCRANLSHVNLSDAFLIEAYLFGANLSGANLSEANLSEANLSEANLSEANLFGAYLSGAYLIGTNLIGANLSNVIVKKTRFGYNEGMTKSLRDYLIERDAIFEDSPPGDRSKLSTPV